MIILKIFLLSIVGFAVGAVCSAFTDTYGEDTALSSFGYILMILSFIVVIICSIYFIVNMPTPTITITGGTKI